MGTGLYGKVPDQITLKVNVNSFQKDLTFFVVVALIWM
jgi:hypothetical protein